MREISTIAQQVIWQSFGKLVSVISTLLLLGLVTRTYGQDGTGIYTLSITYLGFFFLFADLGLNAYLLPFLQKDSQTADKLFTFRLLWSILLVFGCNGLAFLMPFATPPFLLSVFLGSLSIICSGLFTSCNLIFQNRLRYDRSILAASIGALLVIPVAYLIVQLGWPVAYLALAPLLGWIVNALLSFYFVNQFHRFHWHFDSAFVRSMLLAAWPISLTLLLNTVYFRVDSFILTSSRSFAEVGVYNFAYQFFQTALVLPTFIMNAFYPILLQVLRNDRKRFRQQITYGVIVLGIFGLMGTLATYLIAPILLPMVSGDTGFQPSIASLQILSLGFPAFFISSLLMWVLVTLQRNKTMLFIYVVGLVVNIVLNLLYIPTYSFYAASWITVISEVVILVLQLIIIIPLLRKA